MVKAQLFIDILTEILEELQTTRLYPLEFCDGKELKLVELPATVTVTGATINVAAGLAGLGLVQLPRFKRDGALQVVLPHLPPPPEPVWVLYPQNRLLSPRVRVFIDWLTEVFAGVDCQTQPRPMDAPNLCATNTTSDSLRLRC
jgi:DNA-binding transcriptional LysR family regulator